MQKIKALVSGIVWFLVLAIINALASGLVSGITFTGVAYLALRTAIFAVPSFLISLAVLRLSVPLGFTTLVCLLLLAIERATFQYEIFLITTFGVINYLIDFVAVLCGVAVAWLLFGRGSPQETLGNRGSGAPS